MNLSELNPRVRTVSFIAPTWQQRTQQLVTRVDVLITAGGNTAVIDQAIQAAAMKKPHLHISGANTLTDLRIAKLKNPNLVVLTPEQVLELDSAELLKKLSF